MTWDEINIALAKWGAEVKKRTDRVLKGTKLKDRIVYNLNIKNNNLFIKYPGYAVFVSAGRRRGAKAPPWKTIGKWADDKGIQFNKSTGSGFITKDSRNFLISRAIGRDGIKAKPFLHFPKKVMPLLLNMLGPAAAKDIAKQLRIEFEPLGEVDE